MKISTVKKEEDFELKKEYDFSKGIRGRFYKPRKVSITIRIDDDILMFFKKFATEEKTGYQTQEGARFQTRSNIPVTVLSGKEVVAAVRNNPFSGISTNPSHLLVVVPRTRSDQRRLHPLLKERWSPEAIALGSRVAYLWCANGVARSPLWAAVDRAWTLGHGPKYCHVHEARGLG